MTPDTNMVERLGRAIFDAIAKAYREGELSDADIVWNSFENGNPRAWRVVARAAIAAMREPTSDMKFMAGSVELKELSFALGTDDLPHGNPALTMDQAEGVWAAMIDAALAEGEKG